MAELLSTEQVLLLENLMYMTNSEPFTAINNIEGNTVADLINVNMDSIVDDKDYGSYMTGKDWKNIIEAVRNDETLMNMQITATHVDNSDGGGGGLSTLFTNPDTGEAVVAFRGTASDEWKDNFLGGAGTNTADGVSTQQQINALEWYQSLDLDDYSTITVTGHSKGGNKAKYITIMDSSVDRCISFDGQGFSDEFIEKYSDEISMRQDKISNNNAQYDYVNLLLNDIGNTTYYEGYDYGEGGFLENHCPNTIMKFDEETGTFSMVTVDSQGKEMQELDEFLNSYLRSMNEEDKQKALTLIGTLVEQGFGGANINDIVDTLLEGDNIDQVAYLFAYIARYDQENPGFSDTLNSILTKMGLENYVKIVDTIDSVLNSNYFDIVMDIMDIVSDLSTVFLPDWLLEEISLLIYDKLGITLSPDDLRKFLHIICTVNDDMHTIKVVSDGSDIRIDSNTDPHSFSVVLRQLEEAKSELANFSKLIQGYSDDISIIKDNLRGSHGMVMLRLTLSMQNKRVYEESQKIASIGDTLEEICSLYSKTENKIIANIN